ncbi:MAG: pirin family protein [Coriobacteriales bacterium]|jgi:redox-sensitive bicupin YhaK (pirin superfamily)
MQAKIVDRTKGSPAIDGAGVHLVRVLGNQTVKTYDPFLMLDAFDSGNPDDWSAGFPMHPHRGIETVTFMQEGSMLHRDHLGTKAVVGNGGAQWLTAGSGAYHEEMPQPSDRMLGIQLWLNLPAKDKMEAHPAYHSIMPKDIEEIAFEGGKLRLVCGSFQGYTGHQGSYLPLDFYDIHLDRGASLEFDVPEGRSNMVFTLQGPAVVGGEHLNAKTAAKLDGGTDVRIETPDGPAEVLFMSSTALHEPVAWWGPVVMNTEDELDQAWMDMQNGSFVKESASYDEH